MQIVYRKWNGPARRGLSVVSGHDRKAVQGENQVGGTFTGFGESPVLVQMAAR